MGISLEKDILKAIELKDKVMISDLFEQIPFPAPTSIVLLFARILCEEWHEQHDEIADCLQVSKNPEIVSYLHEACLTNISYLEKYAGLDAFHRRCTWAIADIGTEEAKQTLVDLTKRTDAALVEYAQERIDNWQAELHRKGV